MNFEQWHKYAFTSLCIVFTVWWLVLFGTAGTPIQKELFSSMYCAMALFGGICGLYYSYRWGAWRRTIGKVLHVFSIGLLCQVLGQIIYGYYISVENIRIPYLSIGDVCFLSSVPLFVYGAYLLYNTVQSYSLYKKMPFMTCRAVGISALLVVFSYGIFLFLLPPTYIQLPAAVLVDVGYIAGGMFGCVFALYAYRAAKGSTLQQPILIFCFALAAQYVADYMFIVQAHHETWSAAGLNDYVYFISYSLFTWGILRLHTVFEGVEVVIGKAGETRKYFLDSVLWRFRRLSYFFLAHDAKTIIQPIDKM